MVKMFFFSLVDCLMRFRSVLKVKSFYFLAAGNHAHAHISSSHRQYIISKHTDSLVGWLVGWLVHSFVSSFVNFGLLLSLMMNKQKE